MLKYASAQIMTADLAPKGASRRELRRFAHRHHFDYEVRPGYLYVRSRAISSRCNDNFDEFPAEELEKSYRTFIGKPVFVNHVNHDHRRARGVIIDAVLHKDSNRDGSRDWWVELLQEVDGVRFPRLAKEILEGNISRTSMGTDVEYSICSACRNRATTPAEYCQHIPGSKGMMLYRRTASGQKVGEIIRETCYGLRFFENSLLVEPPADPTAFFTGVDSRGLSMTAASALMNEGEAAHALPGLAPPSRALPSHAEVPQHTAAAPDSVKPRRINLEDLGRKAQAERAKLAANQEGAELPAFPWDKAPKVNLPMTEKGWDDPRRKDMSEALDQRKMQGGPPKSQNPNVDDLVERLGDYGESEMSNPYGMGTVSPGRTVTPKGKYPGDKREQWARDRWDQAHMPRTDAPEGKARSSEGLMRSKKNIRDRWQRWGKPLACEHNSCPPWKCQANESKPEEGQPKSLLRRMLDQNGLGPLPDVEPPSHRYKDITNPAHRRLQYAWDRNERAGGDRDVREHLRKQWRHHVKNVLPPDEEKKRNDFLSDFFDTETDHWAPGGKYHDPHKWEDNGQGRLFEGRRKTAGWVTYNKSEFPPDAPKNAVGYQPGNGDYKVECGRGCTDSKGYSGHWGRHGAAGMLVRHQAQDGTHRYLLQQRGFQQQHGGTWSIPGGGLNDNEAGKPHRAAFREMKEEMGRNIPELRVSHIHHDDHGGGWGYHTVVADTHHPFSASHPSEEQLGSGWFTEDEIDKMNLHPGFRESWGKVRQSLRENPYHSPYEGSHYSKLAFGEQKAPQDVDTLREDACPVCGDRDTFDGDTCQVCSYVAPPQIFRDPDLEKARQMDLRKDVAEFNDPANPNQIGPDGQPVQDPMDPAALDADGNPMDPNAQDPSLQPGGLPGEVPAEVQTAEDGVADPSALGPDGQPLTDETGAPLDPSMLGPDGQPLQQGQMVLPDGTPIGPQELPAAATTNMGQPFTPGPNMPEGPGEPEGPEGPVTPDELDEDGQPVDPDAGQGAPGTPGDGVADLVCPACGFTAEAAPPTSVDMDTQQLPNVGSAQMDGAQAGDVCPNCGAAQLMSPAEVQGQTSVPMPV